MGVTMRPKKGGKDLDMGYGGFMNLRNKVAELVGPEFFKHYTKPDHMFFFGKEEEKKKFYEKYNAETTKLINDKVVNWKVAWFLFQPDCEGRITYGACKEILKVVGDYDDNILYGYCGRKDCAMFKDFKAALEECVYNKCDLIWR